MSGAGFSSALDAFAAVAPPAGGSAIDVVAITIPGFGDSLPTWFQLLAMTINSMFGAAVARSRNVPVYGTILAGLLVGFGGGAVRDVLLGLEPVAISVWYFLPVGLVGAVVGALIFSDIVSMDRVDVVIQGVVLGLLVTIGAQKALDHDAPVFSAMCLGVITASFGGMAADVMCGQRATVAKQAHWVASALVVGSTCFVVVSIAVGFWAATVVGVAVTAFLRVISQRRQWPSPYWPEESHTTA